MRPNFHLKSTFEAVFVLLTLASCHPEADDRVLWWASLWESGCVGTVLCCEADDRVLWLASLNECGCLGSVLCSEADERVLWLASLWGRSIYWGMDFALEALC